MKIAVLGGGITGITATRLLVERGHEVRTFEAGPRTGGLCQSETIDGFVADRAGGHIIFSKDEEVMGFVLDALEDVGYHTCTRQTSIYYHGKLVQYPFENGIGDLPVEDRYLCLRDYVEASFRRRQGEERPDNFKDWCTWRFGEAMCLQFMHPYNEKIWNIPLEEMGIEWVSGRVPDAPLDDVLKSAIGLRTEGYRHQSRFHYPLTGGFESVVRGIERRIPEGIVQCSHPVQSVERLPDGRFAVDGVTYDRVVSTIPLQDLGVIFRGLPDEIRHDFESLDWVSLACIFLALQGERDEPHSWMYFPHPENGPQNRVTWLGNYSPKNTPEGTRSLMAEVTYYRDPGASDEELTRQVVEGLERCGMLERDEVLWSRQWHSRYAYILYRRGLEEHLARIRRYCEAQGLDIIGRFGNYSYFNSDMCIRAAMDLAASYPSD